MSSSTSNVKREESSESDVEDLGDRLGRVLRVQLDEEEPQPDEEHPVEEQPDVEQPQQIDGNLFVDKECTKGCKTCPDFVKSETFTSSVTEAAFRLNFEFGRDERASISCKSVNVVYLITCRGCKLQYVGETFTKLNERMNKRRSAIINKKGDPYIMEHLKAGKCPNPFRFTVQIVEKLPGNGRKNDGEEDTDVSKIRRKAQDKWILTLRTLYPYGFNGQVEDVEFDDKIKYNCNYAKFKTSTNSDEITEKLINIVRTGEFSMSIIAEIRSIIFSVDPTPFLMIIEEKYKGAVERYKEAVPKGSAGLNNPPRLQLHSIIKDLFNYRLRPFGKRSGPRTPQR